MCDLVRDRAVTAIYAPHGVINDVLTDLLPRMAPGVRLLEPNPMRAIEASYRRELAKAEAAGQDLWFDTATPSLALAPIERAGIIRIVNTIPGMTDVDKIDAVIAVMGSCPSWRFVRSAPGGAARPHPARLVGARRRQVLCVDPGAATT